MYKSSTTSESFEIDFEWDEQIGDWNTPPFFDLIVTKITCIKGWEGEDGEKIIKGSEYKYKDLLPIFQEEIDWKMDKIKQTLQ